MRHFAFVCLALCACAGRWPRVDLQTLPRAADAPDAKGLVLLDDESVRFRPDARSHKPIVEVHRHRQVRILRPGGEALARVVVPYRLAFCEVTQLSARAISPDGTEHRYEARDAADLPAYPNWILYSDQRARLLDIKENSPGTYIEYEYSIRYSESRMFDFQQHFGEDVPARRVRLTVSAPPGWAIDHLERKLNDPVTFPPVETRDAAETRWQWERRGLPALPSETLAPRWTATTVWVRLAKWDEAGRAVDGPRDPRELSAWQYQMTRPPDPDAATRAQARQIVEALPNDVTARARRLYNWVRDHVSYCAIEIGLGGWRPHGAADVLKGHYGDCKDKANLLKDFLGTVGIASRLVNIYSHDGFPRRFALPTMTNFNHAILAIDLPEGPLLVDPTSRTTPFGALPIGDQEADFLPIVAEGGPLMTAPASAAEENEEQLVVELAPRGGDLAGRFALSLTGASADALRAMLLRTPPADQARPVAQAVGMVHGRLHEIVTDGAAPPDTATPIKVSGQVTVPGALAGGGTQVLSVAGLLASAVPALPAGARQTPLVLPSRRRSSHQVRITIPDNKTISGLPETAVIERPFGRYSLSWKSLGGHVVIERALVVRERIFAAAEYGAVKQFFDEILAAEARGAILRQKEK
jgi:transglutaminase-like putative cysteine protease